MPKISVVLGCLVHESLDLFYLNTECLENLVCQQLSKAEEEARVVYLVYILTPKMTMANAWAISIKSVKADQFPESGPNWFTRSRKCHSLKNGQSRVNTCLSL